MPFLRSATIPLLLLCSFVSSGLSAPSIDTLLPCLWKGTYRVVTPSSYDYVSASIPYNTRLSIAPAAIVYPANPQDVAHAVTCGAQSNVPVVARSGGHSYAGHGLGGDDGSLVIDVSLFKELRISEDGETAVIQTGLRLGDVSTGLYNRGRRALPHGTCPYVGLGGHAGYGGFGFLSREWGLLVDRMTAAEMVLADGKIVNVSKTENSDLFWAIRGSVASFGIVTSYSFKTEPAPLVTTNYNYTFVGDQEDAAKCFLAYQEFAPTAPSKLGMQFSIENDLTWRLRGSWSGPKHELEDVILPLAIQCAPLHTFDPWAKEQAWLPYLAAMSGRPPKQSDCFYTKSFFTKEESLVPYETILAFFSYLFTKSPAYNGKLKWFVETNIYGGDYSAISAVPSAATAYVHRDRLLGMQMHVSSHDLKPPYTAAGFDFMDGAARVLQAGYSHFAAYANYVDPLLSDDDWPTLYYGDQYSRLLEIKNRVDPGEVFSYPQAIGKHGIRVASSLAIQSAEAELRRLLHKEL